MRLSSGFCVIVTTSVGLIAGLEAAAQATPRVTATVQGKVVSTHGRWSPDHRNIITDVVVHTDDGRDVTMVQLGGDAGDYRMVQFPSEPRLRAGDQVAVTASGVAGATPVVEGVSIAAPAGGALPWVQSHGNDNGPALRWAGSCVLMTYASEATAEIAGDAERAVMDAAIDSWNQGTGGCSYLELQADGLADAGAEVGRDAVNLIIFRERTWCRPAVDGKEAKCYDARAAAITTVVYVTNPDSDRYGEIVDADIELNGVNFAVSTGGVTLGGAPCLSDLANTLTHELGHVMGLDHNCITDDAAPPRDDGDGNPVPYCSDVLTAEIRAATMYWQQGCGETSKASLEADDIDAICSIYPKADDPGVCAPPSLTTDAGCCQSSSETPPLAPILFGLGIAAALVRRRPQRRRAT